MCSPHWRLPIHTQNDQLLLTWPVLHRQMAPTHCLADVSVYDSICGRCRRIKSHSRRVAIGNDVLMTRIRRNSTARWRKIDKAVVRRDHGRAVWNGVVKAIRQAHWNERIEMTVHLVCEWATAVTSIQLSNSMSSQPATNRHKRTCFMSHFAASEYRCWHSSVHSGKCLKHTHACVHIKQCNAKLATHTKVAIFLPTWYTSPYLLPTFQPLAIELFQSSLPSCGTLPQSVTSQHHWVFLENVWRHITSFVPSQSGAVPVQWLHNFWCYNWSCYVLTYWL